MAMFSAQILNHSNDEFRLFRGSEVTRPRDIFGIRHSGEFSFVWCHMHGHLMTVKGEASEAVDTLSCFRSGTEQRRHAAVAAIF